MSTVAPPIAYQAPDGPWTLIGYGNASTGATRRVRFMLRPLPQQAIYISAVIRLTAVAGGEDAASHSNRLRFSHARHQDTPRQDRIRSATAQT